MAEQDAVVAAEQAATDPVENSENPKGKLNGLLMILVPAMLLSGGLGGWLSYSQYPVIAEVTYNMFGGEKEEATEPIEFGEFMELSNIVVNPYDSDGRRLLMVSLGLETSEGSILESVTAREMVVRDTIIKILGNRTVDQLASIEERSALKSEIRQAVNGIVSEDGEINRLYFTQYVLQ